MARETAITVSSVHKSFILPHEKQSSFKSLVINLFRKHRSFEKQHVLHDMSFEVQKGEFFGIVGRNGGGKSTLLKLLASIYPPDQGSVRVEGKLTPFIELGVGFNPELTGRENVYLNAALLGFSRNQTDEMYEGIVEFAELPEFMDQKLKNYSSGMQVRLAFSIAIRAKSDILLIDEVLAVGDEAFQRKCLDVFEKYKANKQTIVLVTHDMETVRKFCTRAMLINNGEIIKIGNPRAVAEKYSQLNQDAIDLSVAKGNEDRAVNQFLKARIFSYRMEPKHSFKVGERMTVEVSWHGLDAGRIESLGVNIFKLSGEHVTGINTRFTKHRADWKDQGRIGIEFTLDITPGRYFILVEAFEEEGKRIESLLGGPQFTVAPSDITWSGLVELPHQWREQSPSGAGGDDAS
jgi:ABC-type polysaccharide/polyol phosphate transport system ATPase subunit